MDIQYAKDLILQDIIVFLVDEHKMSYETALSTIYNSTYYKKLQCTETGLYFQSSDYNFEILEHEIKYGK